MALPWFRGLLSLIFQETCPLCDQTAATVFCPDCQQRVQACQRSHPPEPQKLLAWGTYREGLREAIAALKFKNNPQLARPLGHWLAAAWLAQAPPQLRPLVVPLPMHAAKRHERGFDHAELLARHFCHYAHLPLAARGLERNRATQAMFQLNAQERQRNIAGAFTLGPDFRRRLPKRPILLLDDIYTTGATVKAAAQVLRRAELTLAGVVVLAVPRRSPRSTVPRSPSR